jgi:hypothetical protein
MGEAREKRIDLTADIISKVAHLRERILQLRERTAFATYVQRDDSGQRQLVDTTNPHDFAGLWGLWQNWFPLHPAPPQFEVKNQDDAEDALDAFLLRLEELFGPAPFPEGPQAIQHEVRVIPGGFVYGEDRHDLCGKPLEMLRELLASRWRKTSADDLRKAIRPDDCAINNPEQAVKDTAKRLRVALRAAARRAGLDCKDPLRSTGQGKDLAYELTLP